MVVCIEVVIFFNFLLKLFLCEKMFCLVFFNWFFILFFSFDMDIDRFFIILDNFILDLFIVFCKILLFLIVECFFFLRSFWKDLLIIVFVLLKVIVNFVLRFLICIVEFWFLFFKSLKLSIFCWEFVFFIICNLFFKLEMCLFKSNIIGLFGVSFFSV